MHELQLHSIATSVGCKPPAPFCVCMTSYYAKILYELVDLSPCMSQDLVSSSPSTDSHLEHSLVHMQASLIDDEKPAETRHANTAAWLAAAQHSSAPAAGGLRNATGEYNCFLNVVIQCLWHCGCLRQAVMMWPKEVYQVKYPPFEPSSHLHQVSQQFAPSIIKHLQQI